MPDSQPNYLTVDPQGRTGANFAGHIQATGIDFQDADPVTQDYAVRWSRVTDGSINGYVYSTSVGTEILQRGPSSGYVKLDASTASGPNLSLATLIANARTGNPPADTAVTVNAANTLGDGGKDHTLTMIDANGNSNFMQWFGLSNLKVRVWSIQYGPLPAGLEVGGTISIPWTSALYMLGAFAQPAGSVNNSGPQLCSWAYFPNTPGSCIVVIRNNSPYGMAAGSTNFIQGIALYA
jgi:hypothetical protein